MLPKVICFNSKYGVNNGLQLKGNTALTLFKTSYRSIFGVICVYYIR